MTVFQLVIYTLLIHFLADFGLQTHEQATKKGQGSSFLNTALIQHVAVYSLVWLFGFGVLEFGHVNFSYGIIFVFSVITFITHYATDWFTSRISKPFFSNQDYHNGFVVVGFDQLIHGVTMVYLVLVYAGKF